jgi:hypothetical protein
LLAGESGKSTPSFRQHDAFPLSPPERDAEECLKFLELAAEERHPARVVVRGFGQAAGIGDQAEVSQAVERETAQGEQGF